MYNRIGLSDDDIKVSGVTLRVDVINPSAAYLIDNNVTDFGTSFTVNGEQLDEMILFIKLTGKSLNIPIPRIYVSGSCLKSKSELNTKDEIVRRLSEKIRPAVTKTKSR